MEQEKLICHVCKKEKKPYTVFMNNDIFSLIEYMHAREDGEICQRCDQYYAMTGEFKDATEQEFEIAKKSVWFANMVKKFWEKDKKLIFNDEDIANPNDGDNMRGWEGTATIANWCRNVLNSTLLSQPSAEGIIIADKQNPPEENRTRCPKCNKLIFTAFKSERCDCAD